MQRDTALVLVLALLALLALGVAGATLENPVSSSGDGLFGGGEGGVGSGSGAPMPNGSDQGPPPLRGASGSGVCFTVLDTLPVKAGLFLLVLGISLYVYRAVRELWVGAVTFGFVGFLTYLTWALLSSCGPLLPPVAMPSPSNPVGGNRTGGAGGGGAQAAQSAVSDPSVLLAVLLVVAVAGAVLLLVLASGDATEAVEEDDAEDVVEESTDVAAVGRAAGRAADRIDEDADFENEVYRAWVEMTDHLSVAHPESSTPAEFADAAVAAGMTEGDVRELTTLFEEVRYGDYAVTADREQRAVAALRRIEGRYADADATDDDFAARDRGGGESR